MLSQCSVCGKLIIFGTICRSCDPATKRLDPHGQPLDSKWNASHRRIRSLDEILGLIKGILADGQVSEPEVIGLAQWLSANTEHATEWPINVLIDRIARVLEDKRIDPEELQDLHDLLLKMVGQEHKIDFSITKPTSLPLTQPLPSVSFPDKMFVFSGRFIIGTRQYCQGLVVERGGYADPRVSRRINYLVIGEIGSRDWVHTTHGRKIEAAVNLIERGYEIDIVSEEHWTSFLF